MRVLLLAADQIDPSQVALRSGEAGLGAITDAGRLAVIVRRPLSPNSVHALLGHGVVERLNALPLEGTLGNGLDALIPSASLDDAKALLYDADRKTYGRSWAFPVGRIGEPDPAEVRLRIDNREYQQTLSRLVDMATRASREGLLLWMRI